METNKPVNFEVTKKENETEDRLIKRFLKKSSKNKLLEIYLEKRYFESDSVKNRKKKRRKQFLSKQIKENK